MTQASTAVIAIATTAEVTMTMGSWRGTASQLSLPHMSVPFLRCLAGLRRLGRAAALGPRPGTRRELLPHHLGEELGRHGTERRRRQLGALPRERRVGGAIEGGTGAARRLDPGGELVGAHGADREVHVGEAVAA